MSELKQKRQPKPPIDDDGEVRELTLAEIRKMKPIREAMPELIEAVNAYRNKGGRPKSEAPNVRIGFRLAADVVASIRETGPGYDARVEDVLRGAFIKTELPKSRAVTIDAMEAFEPVSEAGTGPDPGRVGSMENGSPAPRSDRSLATAAKGAPARKQKA